jgi:hypothetical protein
MLWRLLASATVFAVGVFAGMVWAMYWVYKHPAVDLSGLENYSEAN